MSSEATQHPKCAPTLSPLIDIINIVDFSKQRSRVFASQFHLHCNTAKGRRTKEVACKRQEARRSGGISSICWNIVPAEETPTTAKASKIQIHTGMDCSRLLFSDFSSMTSIFCIPSSYLFNSIQFHLVSEVASWQTKVCGWLEKAPLGWCSLN